MHLSDIHFQGYGMGWDEDADQRAELIRDLRRLIDRDGAVDGLIVGGDIAFSADPSEYDIASKWLGEVCQACGIDFSRVWTVPGNHDIERGVVGRSEVGKEFRRVVRSASTSEIDKHLKGRLSVDPAAEGVFLPLRNYNTFAGEFGCAVTAGQPHWFDTTLVCDGQPIRLTGLNSAMISDPTDGNLEDNAKLVLGTWQCVLPREEGLIHIAVCHHPPNWLRDWDVVEPYLRRAHLLLFGHEHKYAAHQISPSKTVYVYAGAVGPERMGGSSADESLPSWHLLTIVCVGDAVTITVEPRVWHRTETCFGEHPDGVATFNVALDLARAEGDLASEEVNPPVMAAMAASPLAAETFPSAETPPIEVRDRGGDSVERRKLGVRFMHLPPTRRLEIARALSVIDERQDLELPSAKMYELILTRIRDRSLVDRLMEELERG